VHSLRHYSATELIAAGVDVRTVAGRLGHGSGGATTLKVYAAWVDEADRRAATTMASIMPAPIAAPREPRGPYEVIAAQLREESQLVSCVAATRCRRSPSWRRVTASPQAPRIARSICFALKVLSRCLEADEGRSLNRHVRRQRHDQDARGPGHHTASEGEPHSTAGTNRQRRA
jgi:hypothetical protein